LKENIRRIRQKIKQPWVAAVLLVACIPLLPEYFAPILAAGALMAASYDARITGSGIQVGTIGKIMLIYIAYLALGLLYSPHFLSTLATLSMWIIMFCVYLALTTVLNNPRRLDSALFAVSLAAGVVGLIGCIQYMLKVAVGLDISLEFWSFIDNTIFGILPIEMKPIPPVLRASSTFNNANIFSEAMVIALPVAAYYSFYGKREKYQLICRFCLMTIAGGIAFSFSRGSYLALLAVALVFCVANIRKIVVMSITLISGLLLVPDSVIARLFTVAEKDNSINERFSIWTSCMSFIKSNPIFGVGAGISNTWSMLLQKGINAPHMHNLALQLIVEGGIIAVAIYAVACWRFFRSGVSMLIRDKGSRMTGVMFMAFLLGFVTNSMFDFPLMTPKLVGMFLMILAFSDVASRLYLNRQTSALQDVLTFQKRLVEATEERVACSNIVNNPK
jgi:putative inorganic carbon (HCO3(-)) transporter